VQEGKMVAIKETFGEDTAKTWVLDLEKNVKMNFAWVPQESHTGGGFWMSKFEVTQEQYERISATNTCPIMRSPSCPATGLKEQVEAFCRKLNQLHPDALKGMAARLPTTAEWIYACKAGSTNTFYSGDTEDDLFVAAWAGDNGQSRLHACGLKMPNAFWLYDMLGSSKEWVSDGQPCGEHLFHNSKLTGYCLEGVGFRIVVAGQSNEKRINDFMDGVSNDKP
jgi:formylglycine-generating enzyme required for sulfatase activity